MPANLTTMKNKEEILHVKITEPKTLLECEMTLPKNWIFEDYVYLACDMEGQLKKNRKGKINYKSIKVYIITELIDAKIVIHK